MAVRGQTPPPLPKAGRGRASTPLPKTGRGVFPIWEGGLPEMGRGPLPVAGIQTPDIEHREISPGESNTGARCRADETEPSFFPPVPISPRKDRSKPRREHQTSAAIVEAFEDIWTVYPRRVAKAAALVAFERAVKAGADPLEIKAGVLRYVVEQERKHLDPVKRHDFTKHFAAWLNGRQWEDETAPAPQANGFDRSAAQPNRRLKPMERFLARRLAK
jgi:hypothetical protein